MCNMVSHFGGGEMGMTDVGTLQSQLFPAPLISKSLCDVMGLEIDSYMLDPVACGVLNAF